MTACCISVCREIVNEGKVAAYAALGRPALETAGGIFIARGLPEQTYEAGKNTRTVIIEFASVRRHGRHTAARPTKWPSPHLTSVR